MNKDLLKLIETVNPDDTAMLDEIDARVWCLLNWSEYRGIKTHIFEGETKPEPCAVSSNGGTHIDNLIKYTRSRDALKAIRPEGWDFQMLLNSFSGEPSKHDDLFVYYDATYYTGNIYKNIQSPELKSEELAELWVIISATQWERDNNE